MYRSPEFEVGQQVRFLEHVFELREYAGCRGEFTVVGHLLDDDERPLKDCPLLRSNVTNLRTAGAVHSSVLELVPNKPTMPDHILGV